MKMDRYVIRQEACWELLLFYVPVKKELIVSDCQFVNE